MFSAKVVIAVIGLALSTATSGRSAPSRPVVYHFGLTRMSWSNAASYCAHRGWRLVKIDTDYDLSALQHLYSGDDIVWIGLSNTEVGSPTYHWTDCRPYGDYKRAPWALDEPNSLDTQLCVMMKTFEFKTNDCSKGFSIICEEIKDTGACSFEPSNTGIFGTTPEEIEGNVFDKNDCEQSCLKYYYDEKECIGYSYDGRTTCIRYLGEFLIFPTLTYIDNKLAVGRKTCHSYEPIVDSAMRTWNEPFTYTCDETQSEEPISDEVNDVIPETVFSVTADSFASSSSSSFPRLSATMDTTPGIPPTAYQLSSNKVQDSIVDSTMTPTAVLPFPTPTMNGAATDSSEDAFPFTGHMQTSTIATGPREVTSSSVLRHQQLHVTHTTLTGHVYGTATGPREVTSSSVLHHQQQHVTPPTLTGNAYGTATGPTEVASSSVLRHQQLHVTPTTVTGHMYGTATGPTEVTSSSVLRHQQLHVTPTTLTGHMYGTATGPTEVTSSSGSYSTYTLHASPTTTVYGTATRMVSSSCVCPCRGDLKVSHAKLVKELMVEKTTLSSFRRKKTSAKDDRPSAQVLGNVGIILLAVTGVLILILDADVIVKLISSLLKQR
ncbi:protein MTL1-like [Haliotis rufescens]|uniref:protein MTL1-like n=1 Tax=Haliotis rufescens TaxID=6454 RepID=UPI00201F0F84|nr:protein MTL1-like [Haliotis rufescens]